MRFATLPDGSPDGRLHLVSRDNARCIPAEGVQTLLSLMENWDAHSPALEAQYAALNEGGGAPFDPTAARAPLPRAWQWLDGSAYDSHGDLMQKVFGLDPNPKGRPLMYQGMSDRFYGGTDDIPLPSEEDGIDFEGEFGVICDAVPMGSTPAEAAARIRLVVQINDWSLRRLAPIEMKTGFGWVQAKPACAVAPVALTPDELGEAWRDARVDLPLTVTLNGASFGHAEGYPMSYGFDELLAHAAHSRDLVAGTVLGSGTVSNDNYREVGSSCLAERRAIELLDEGAPSTPFMGFGDRVAMECRSRDQTPLFGAIDQKVIKGGRT
ncbi:MULTISPECIES: fumarylacetoacetate hydrolase family protein [unclassified Halomonas]|uniref:fumarylacetoacetate hydrolase family protein n=1 Tax=unclassified Halomonas TaxID=2609666 RepID=UPI0021E4A6C5|nr:MULTISPECIES: fumarylacetoacetate hydrolase family protein [unclassified Halomonas]UYG00521.1 fumarylacetoacetate hydrolase family protein [Halomonas sp. GD1P12]WNL38404.1 fumarylacetoacetate hydrolase family protein [Halomonas sp. PAMB 3232]WNL41704.1 fumarylacetoacetate hydrolase family protein [Halomonas sp. PAMB 3264]